MKLFLFISLSLLLHTCTTVTAFECLRRTIEPDEHNEGYIRSPGYPYHYPTNFCIMWYHRVFTKTLLTINIVDFDVPSADHCGGNSSNKVIIGPHDVRLLCDSAGKKEKYQAVISDYFYVLFIVKENFVERGKGFELYYILDEDSGSSAETPGGGVVPPRNVSTTKRPPTTVWPSRGAQTQRPHSIHSELCHYVLSQSFGLISVNDNLLAPGRNFHGKCSWLLSSPYTTDRRGAPVIQKYDLKFHSFNLHLGCCSLTVYQGADDGGEVKGYYESDSHPYYLTVDGPQVFIQLSISKPDHIGNFSIKFSRQIYSSSYKIDSGSSKQNLQACFPGDSYCSHNESRCYRDTRRCDGYWDCPLSGADEMGCGSCPKDQFSCGTTYCFKATDRCNGKGSCSNYRDEQNCSPEQCSTVKGLFLCRNKRCIYEKWRCDGSEDCEDGSDEDYCDQWSSPRLVMACVVGTLISSLLLVLILSFACRVYSLRVRQRRGQTLPSLPESPLSRIERDLLSRRVPPPQYHEAMMSSRSYDEAYMELLNQGRLESLPEGGISSPTDGAHSNQALPTTSSSSSGGRSRNGRRGRGRQDQPSLTNPDPRPLQASLHYLMEEPPSYSTELPPDSSNTQDQPSGSNNDTGHEMQPLQMTSSSTADQLLPPPYSLHNHLTSASNSDDDDDDDEIEEDEESGEDFPDRAGEDCSLNTVGSEDDDPDNHCLSLEDVSVPGQSSPHNGRVGRCLLPTTSSLVVPSSRNQPDVVGKEEIQGRVDEEIGDKKNVAGERNEDSSCLLSSECETAFDDDSNVGIKPEPPAENTSHSSIEAGKEDEDDCECILSFEMGMEDDHGEGYGSNTTSDVACLLSNH